MSDELDENYNEEDFDYYDYSEELLEEEEIVERSLSTKIFLGAVAFMVISGLVYMSGVYQYLFFQRTPSSATTLPVENYLNAETLTIPLTVFIVTESKQFGSARSEEDVLRLVEKASEILGQAAIALTVKEIHTLSKSDEEVWDLFQNPRIFIQSVDEVDPETINLFLTRNLQGINGIAYTGLGSIAVADYTTVNDFRVLAHEIGHMLGLEHVSGFKGQLMYRGADGIDVSSEETEEARRNAEAFN